MIEVADTECYRNYWLLKLKDIATGQFQSFQIRGRETRFTPVERDAMRHALSRGCVVTFNGIHYDMPMIACAMAGFTCEQLKYVNDSIFSQKMQPWDVEKTFGVRLPEWIDHIDLFNVVPGDFDSLKIYGGRLHCKYMQDLPYDPSIDLTEFEMDETDKYCGNDLETTEALYRAVEEDIATRIDLTTQYGVDMRSKSDAQIAEAAFKKLLKLDYKGVQAMKQAAYVAPGTQFYYTPPPFIKFSTPAMQQTLAMICRSPFTVGKGGRPEMTDELNEHVVAMGGSTYSFGSGGLHSKEKRTRHVADAIYSLLDVDADSFYPKIISLLRMFPHQIGEVFLTIYDGWIEVRLDYKAKGEKKKSATFKIKVNGTFGKLGSIHSILFAPQLLIQTTLTGQLGLAMLIEMMESVPGISVVSANTDGIVIKCERKLHMVRDAIVERWKRETGFTTEGNEYMALFSRDVNSYIAVKPPYTDKKGVAHPVEFKCKGAYGDEGLAKNPTNVICVDAVKAYLLDGVPLETTIRRCWDIRKFVTVKNVKGGGVWVKDTLSATTIKGKTQELVDLGWTCGYDLNWYEPCGDLTPRNLHQAHEYACSALPRQFLGKAVRWYYGRGQTGHIAYKSNGNLVGGSTGAKPCMMLPDVLPPDIDYEWYVAEAQSLLRDLNCC